MRYIVPGGAGFIGSNLADTLAQNHDVVIIDNLATGRRVNIEHLLDHPRVTFIEGSITGPDLLAETIQGADGIFLRVAIPSVSRAIGRPSPPGQGHAPTMGLDHATPLHGRDTLGHARPIPFPGRSSL